MSVKVRPSTMENYRGLAERHLTPHLGGKPLSRITDADAQKLYDTVKHHGRLKEHPVYGYSLSDSVVHSVHALLYSALKAAVEAHLLAKNPLADLPAPKPNYKPMKVLNKAQLEVFMKVIKTDEVWHDFFYTEMTTGLRRGELCGLMWTDFDADAGTLTINRTLHKDGSVGDTKTYAGARTITLPAGTAALLRKRQTSALSQWIFHHPLKPEQPVNASSAYNRLKALLKKGGLPDIRFHDLRHTFATHALANGVDAKTLAAILGHTNASFTLDTYTHVTGDMQKNAADKIGDYITEMFGGETRLWQSGESVATAASA